MLIRHTSSLGLGKSAPVVTKPTSVEGNYAKLTLLLFCLQKAGHLDCNGHLENKVPTCGKHEVEVQMSSVTNTMMPGQCIVA